MMTNPRIGQWVRIRYNKRIAGFMPLHDATGIVVARSSRKPRNHEIEVDGVRYCVPCGNLMPTG